MEQPKLKVRQVKTKDLVLYVNNARIHTDKQIREIANSIEQFGFSDPVGVWTRPDGASEIVEGHGRVLAAELLGLDKVPVIELNHLDDEARRAYTHVHNATTDHSAFDWSVLDAEIADLSDFDWGDWGLEPSGKDEAAEAFSKADIPFSLEVGAENNYIVLVFNNDIDWLNAQTVFGIENKQRMSTRQDGFLSEKMRIIGTGRVIDGAEAINRLLG